MQLSPSHVDSKRLQVLVVASAGRACALPIRHVREIMRPLPIEPFKAAPAFVLGVSVIRGATLPVVDLALLLGAERTHSSRGRYVTLKLDSRDVALSVGEVFGIRELHESELQTLPGLVDNGASGLVESLSTHDSHLLRVLRAASVLPPETWAALAGVEATP
jgi:purine-binding chemotaxis protein CheW